MLRNVTPFSSAIVLQGVENVYTQHIPLMSDMLDPLLKGRLRDTSYPFIDPPNIPSQSGTSTPSNAPNHPMNQR